MVAVVGELMDRPEAAGIEIEALAICGMTRTEVFVDSAGEPLRPAITWADGRATMEADQLKALLGEGDPGDALFGPVNAYHTLARMLWVRNNEPKVIRSTAWVFEPKDFLNFRLTGRASSDRISLSRVCTKATGNIAEGPIRRTGLSPDLLPPLSDPTVRPWGHAW